MTDLAAEQPAPNGPAGAPATADEVNVVSADSGPGSAQVAQV